MELCTEHDVQQRLKRPLTPDEQHWFDSMLQEATALVLSYLRCPPDHYQQRIPSSITIVTSRMIARVIQEGDIDPTSFGATQYGATAGPFSQQLTFTTGSRTGAPWLTKNDKTMLDPHRCSGKAFSINTAPTRPQLTREQAHHILTTTDKGWN